jgi:hypothetical protein
MREHERRQLLCRRSGCFCPGEDVVESLKVHSVTLLGDPNRVLEIAGVDWVDGELRIYCHPPGGAPTTNKENQ